MTKFVLLAAATLAGVTLAAPVQAQANDKQLVIYGNDKCPEGVICVRAPESERYRIPQTLRTGPLAPPDQPWAARAASVSRVGDTGAGTCSAGGEASGTGCWNQMMKDYRADRRGQNAAAAASPEPK